MHSLCLYWHSADEDVRLSVAEFLTRANFGLNDGNFEMDFDDGQIRYKLFYHFKDGEFSTNDANYIIVIPEFSIEKYSDGLLAVLFGMKSPKQAFEDSENL